MFLCSRAERVDSLTSRRLWDFCSRVALFFLGISRVYQGRIRSHIRATYTHTHTLLEPDGGGRGGCRLGKGKEGESNIGIGMIIRFAACIMKQDNKNPCP